MNKMSSSLINKIAEKRYTRFIINEGLANGKKISYKVWQLFKAETLRRKKLDSKPKKKKAKTGPPVVKRIKKVEVRKC